MSLFDKINNDMKAAMKAKEKEKLEAIRAIKSQLLLAKTSSGSSDDISEKEGIKILQKMVKQRKDSAEVYKSQDRMDLYEKEMKEVAFIEPYLPKQLSQEEIVEKLKAIIEKTGASSPKDMGKVMGLATKELAGLAEGKIIATKVKELLNK